MDNWSLRHPHKAVGNQAADETKPLADQWAHHDGSDGVRCYPDDGVPTVQHHRGGNQRRASVARRSWVLAASWRQASGDVGYHAGYAGRDSGPVPSGAVSRRHRRGGAVQSVARRLCTLSCGVRHPIAGDSWTDTRCARRDSHQCGWGMMENVPHYITKNLGRPLTTNRQLLNPDDVNDLAAAVRLEIDLWRTFFIGNAYFSGFDCTRNLDGTYSFGYGVCQVLAPPFGLPIRCAGVLPITGGTPYLNVNWVGTKYIQVWANGHVNAEIKAADTLDANCVPLFYIYRSGGG